MIPKTYPSKIIGSNTACVIAEITPGPNDVAWETYIPVKSVTSSKINRYDADGSIGVSVLSSLTGKTSWTDYIPVFRVITSNPWRTDTDGHIPVEVLEGSLGNTFSVLGPDGTAYNGDEVILLGTQDGETITAAELAELARTIPYEILTNLNTRIPRIYR
jgi:hypothetical protein